MFDSSSRYGNVDTASLAVTDDSGEVQVHVYKRRRFLPQLATQQTLLMHRLDDADRLDNLAAQYIGDAQQSYRICDANPILHPRELAGPPGRQIRIAMMKL